MASTKVAIFSVSAGAGHVRAAQAIEAAAVAWFPDVEAVHVDVLDLVPAAFRRAYADGYLQLVRRSPALWGYLYERTDTGGPLSALDRLRGAIEGLSTRWFVRALRDLAPDHVVCTHFLPAQLLSGLIASGAFDRPVWVQVTDFDIHASWLHARMTGYFAAHEEVARRMLERGIPASAVVATGIPVMPAFGEPHDRTACAAELGIDPGRRTLLLLAGAAGVTGVAGLAARLLALDDDFQIVALAGRNAGLLTDLRILASDHPGRMVALATTSAMDRVMACADLTITKSGGLTTSECLALGVPMLVVSPIPGQEQRNADFLVGRGAALEARDPEALVTHVRALLADPVQLASMRDNARAAGRPDAARRVLETILGR